MSRNRTKRNIGLFLLGLIIATGVGAYLFREKLTPLPKSTAQLVRYEGGLPLSTVLHDLEDRKIIRSAAATGLYARLKKKQTAIQAGTYSLSPGMTADEVLLALTKPITVKVTVPEYYWIDRTATLLEKLNVAPASEYQELAKKPAEFEEDVSFPLPKGSLEGYLFPDTYKMQPLVGARSAIRQQLQAFEKRIWKGLGEPKNLNRIVIIGSMVEREAKLDVDRPLIASVIENRLRIGMPLEIDATVLYGQEWHEPTREELRTSTSPYNTYRNRGLPPGPICSPGLKSIEAALKPAKTNYLYYVALPNGRSLFGRTLDEHNANVAKRRRALRSQPR